MIAMALLLTCLPATAEKTKNDGTLNITFEDKGYKDFDVNKIDKRKWLMDNWITPRNGKIAKTTGINAQYAEAFELTPYGRQVSLEEFNALLNP